MVRNGNIGEQADAVELVLGHLTELIPQFHKLLVVVLYVPRVLGDVHRHRLQFRHAREDTSRHSQGSLLNLQEGNGILKIFAHSFDASQSRPHLRRHRKAARIIGRADYAVSGRQSSQALA
jgi:hypothetical protein